MVQAFAAGQVDIMYNNTLSPLPLLEKGIGIRFVAATMRDDIFLAAKPPLSSFGKKLGPVQAIETFVHDNKRKVKISTNPKGTASDLVIRYWLQHSFKNPDDFVQVINAGSQDQFQQSIFSPDIDACSIWGELLEVSCKKDPRLELFAKPQDLMPAQPGGTLVVREFWLREKPELVQKLVAMEARANDLIHRNPQRAAAHYLKYIGGGLVDPALVEHVIASIPDRFIIDPQVLVEPTQRIADLMVQLGYLKASPQMNQIFERKFYEAASPSLGVKIK